MSKDRIDWLIDDKVDIIKLYSHYGIRASKEHNIICPHHDDSTPSARVMDNHLYCWAERRNYYPSDVLKSLSPSDYKKMRFFIVRKFPDLAETYFKSEVKEEKVVIPDSIKSLLDVFNYIHENGLIK